MCIRDRSYAELVNAALTRNTVEHDFKCDNTLYGVKVKIHMKTNATGRPVVLGPPLPFDFGPFGRSELLKTRI